jgi:hypothetical protein
MRYAHVQQLRDYMQLPRTISSSRFDAQVDRQLQRYIEFSESAIESYLDRVYNYLPLSYSVDLQVSKIPSSSSFLSAQPDSSYFPFTFKTNLSGYTGNEMRVYSTTTVDVSDVYTNFVNRIELATTSYTANTITTAELKETFFLPSNTQLWYEALFFFKNASGGSSVDLKFDFYKIDGTYDATVTVGAAAAAVGDRFYKQALSVAKSYDLNVKLTINHYSNDLNEIYISNLRLYDASYQVVPQPFLANILEYAKFLYTTTSGKAKEDFGSYKSEFLSSELPAYIKQNLFRLQKQNRYRYGAA